MGWFCATGCTRPAVGTDGHRSDEPETPVEFAVGKTIYASNCASCHDSSRDGAPRLGFAPAWKRRAAQGEATVIQNAIDGLDLMPPRGGNEELTDPEMADAVRYMLYRAELGIPAKH